MSRQRQRIERFQKTSRAATGVATRENVACASSLWPLLLLIALLAAGCTAAGRPTPRPAAAEVVAATPPPPALVASATATATTTPTARPTATETPRPTATETPGATPIPTATPTRGPTPDGVARVARVPILMYHYVSEPPPDADIYRQDLSVTPSRFESHLRYLQENGYRTITLDELLGFLAYGAPLPARPVILTFDDGYADNYTNAFPLLRKYGMVGHFFIISDFVSQRRDGYMTWPQIEEMARAGQRFGSHSRDHPDLKGKSVDYLVWQALGGLEAIQEHLGYHPRWISYPAGSYDDQVIAVYKSAHYWGGLSTEQGATHTLDRIFALKRVRVRGAYTADDLARLLQLDW